MVDYSRQLFGSDLEMPSAEDYRRGYYAGRLHALLELQALWANQEIKNDKV